MPPAWFARGSTHHFTRSARPSGVMFHPAITGCTRSCPSTPMPPASRANSLPSTAQAPGRSRSGCATGARGRQGRRSAPSRSWAGSAPAPGGSGRRRPRRLAAGNGIVPDHPVRLVLLLADISRGAALVGAVVPLQQVVDVVVGLQRRARPCAGRATAGCTARGRTPPVEHRLHLRRPGLSVGGQRDVGASGVLTGLAPLGLAVAQQEDQTWDVPPPCHRPPTYASRERLACGRGQTTDRASA